jgi:hypothetical protein
MAPLGVTLPRKSARNAHSSDVVRETARVARRPRFTWTRKAAWMSAGLVLSMSACSNPKPILYPNAHYQSVGQSTAEQDIAACQQMAESAGANQGSGKVTEVTRDTALGAGVGAATGAVGGAVYGEPARGAAVGAAAGTAGASRQACTGLQDLIPITRTSLDAACRSAGMKWSVGSESHSDARVCRPPQRLHRVTG